MNISERIELLRKQQGVSLTHLNNAIGAYRGKLTEVSKGKSTLNASEIAVLAKTLSTSTDYLLGNTDAPSPAGQKEKPPAQGGEPVDPVMKEIMDVAEAATDAEREMMLALIKVIKGGGKTN